ncbi:hypothetical protein F4781DRAFT_433747 [Annulohypoxylon bovei var. microspora]|nr:hypothetical protein F4781DRAFT_433747 [Annulohypoxylon bovei var. microspora]
MSANTPKDPSPGPAKSSKTSPRWSEIEDNILKQAVARHGVSHWDDVAKLIWTRKSAEECRARWAEIVPLLHDGLARREQNLGQQRRKRSMTASASIPETSQHEETAYFEPLPPPLIRRRRGQGPEEESVQGVAGDMSNITAYTEPPSPEPRTLSTRKPPPSSLTAALTSRSRRNTEPGARPSQTTASSPGEEHQHEWLAPHPLMPGRFRKQSVSQNTLASKDEE